nr:hypothetical protein [candidate division Zixibacteria bacterium]
MNRALLKLKCHGGISLMETLIALFLTGLVITTVFKVYVNQHKNWAIQENVTDVQQNLRAAIDELSRQIRMAGHRLPLGLDGIAAYNADPDTIIVTYVGSNSSQAVLDSDMGGSGSDLDCNGSDLSGFEDGQLAYIFQPDSGGGEFFAVQSIDIGNSRISPTTNLTRAYPKDAVVLADLQRIKYYVDNSDTLHPNLMIILPGQTPAVYAENIEDLQFRYRMKNGSIIDQPVIIDDIRAVSVGILARSNNPDPDITGDPYQRRFTSTTINLRNF